MTSTNFMISFQGIRNMYSIICNINDILKPTIHQLITQEVCDLLKLVKLIMFETKRFNQITHYFNPTTFNMKPSCTCESD